MNSQNRHFSEYRDKDYRTPRSMREAYGYDVQLYEDNRLARAPESNPYIVDLIINLVVWGSVVLSLSYLIFIYQSIKGVN